MASLAKYSKIIQEYDLRIEGNPAKTARSVAKAATKLFHTNGNNDFFLLHLVTSARAVEVILPKLAFDVELQRTTIRAHFKTMAFVALARSAILTNEAIPPIAPSDARSWEEIVSGCLRQSDSHLAKLVWLLKDDAEKYDDVSAFNQLLADDALKLFQSGG